MLLDLDLGLGLGFGAFFHKHQVFCLETRHDALEKVAVVPFVSIGDRVNRLLAMAYMSCIAWASAPRTRTLSPTLNLIVFALICHCS